MPANPVEFISMFSTGFVVFVLLLSGATKVGRSGRTLDSMGALGIPAFAQRRWIAAAVPLWEIGLGLALLLTSGWLRAVSAALALGTFAVFTVFLIGVLRRGEEVDCGCFGPLSADDRVTGWTVGRNLLLIATSAVVLTTAPGRPPLAVELFTSAPVPVLLVLLAWALTGLAAMLVALVRLRRRPHESAAGGSEGPAPAAAREGDAIPYAELVSREGVTVPLHALGAGSPVLLVFLSAACGKCESVVRRLPEWQRQIGSSVHLRVATSSRPDALSDKYREALPFAYYGASAAKNALGVEGIPSAVLLGGMQHPFVASPVAHRKDEIDALVRGIVNAQAQASAEAG